MSKHTKEPWDYYRNSAYFEIHGNKKEISNTCPSSCNGDLALGEANAKRIVACVNACADIPNETLDSSMFRNAILLKSTYLDLQAENNELRTKNVQLELALKGKDEDFMNTLRKIENVCINTKSISSVINYLRDEKIKLEISNEYINN